MSLPRVADCLCKCSQSTACTGKISPPSPASLASSQMQTQIGPGYPGPASPYGYASTASSSPAFPLPYSPHRSPASGQYYPDGFQYAYHNRFYNPSYQYPPVNDPSLMYQVYRLFFLGRFNSQILVILGTICQWHATAVLAATQHAVLYA